MGEKQSQNFSEMTGKNDSKDVSDEEVRKLREHVKQLKLIKMKGEDELNLELYNMIDTISGKSSAEREVIYSGGAIDVEDIIEEKQLRKNMHPMLTEELNICESLVRKIDLRTESVKFRIIRLRKDNILDMQRQLNRGILSIEIVKTLLNNKDVVYVAKFLIKNKDNYDKVERLLSEKVILEEEAQRIKKMPPDEAEKALNQYL